MVRQVPCKFNGGVVVNVDRFRTTMGGWVRLVFKNVNGSPLARVELTHVSAKRVESRGGKPHGRVHGEGGTPQAYGDVLVRKCSGEGASAPRALETYMCGGCFACHSFHESLTRGSTWVGPTLI